MTRRRESRSASSGDVVRWLWRHGVHLCGRRRSAVHTHLRTTVLTVTCLASLGAPLAAQEAVSAPPRLAGMFTVFVLDRSGAETKGALVGLSDSVVVVRTPTTERTIAMTDVVRIYREGDSLKNGAIIGALFGGASGLALIANCSSDTPCGSGTQIAAALAGVGIWAAIGAGIDALIPGRTLISTPNAAKGSSGLTVALSPERRRAFVGWTVALER